MTLSKDETKTQLDTEGFAVARSVFSHADIAEMRALLEPLFDVFPSLVGPKARDIGALSGADKTGVSPLKQPEIDRPTRLVPEIFRSGMFQRAKAFASELLGGQAHHTFDHVICKMPQSATPTPWHQDQAYLGPHINLHTVNFWIPLQDVDEENGTMVFLPGSHDSGLQLHGKTSSLHPHVQVTEADIARGIVCPMSAGDCSVHLPTTVHAALTNTSSKPRLAWAVHFSRLGRMGYLTPKNLAGRLRGMVRAG